ncbi:hypothetical protein DFH11DRAFT_59613 [Phellopilus nigrolimitatus]|nr:hypothetical protein DFH11DRAFT_59613 [Phellopilus nigrolimitatus]
MADAIADVERFSVEATEAVDEEQSIGDAPFTTEDVPIDISTVKSFEPERDGSHINQVDVLGEPLCRRGSELELLVALPDRPMDVKLTVLDALTSFTVDELPELQKYFTTLKEYLDNPNSEKPEPPLFIEDGKETFILESSASIRRSVESLHVAYYAQQDLDSMSDRESASRPISTVTESISDLETGHKMINCEISCSQPSVSEQWKKFLKDIDGLTTLGYRPMVS